MIMVDELMIFPGAKKPFDKGSCHLTTDGELYELHEFAASIGLLKMWFQPKSTPHYDLTPRRRKVALACGAVFVPGKEQARQRIAKRG